MPNHVFNNISVEEKYADKLKAISKVGLAEFFRPRPKVFEETIKPKPEIDKDFDQYLIQDNLEKEYGFDNWYDWSVENWGTKWGTYDDEFTDSDHTYRYTTAWCPLAPELIDLLAKYIPDFTYHWEEEQGFGAYMEYENGKRELYQEYDIPNFLNTDYEEIQYLPFDHETPFGTYKKGYYYEWSLDEYLGKNLNKAKKVLKDSGIELNLH